MLSIHAYTTYEIHTHEMWSFSFPLQRLPSKQRPYCFTSPRLLWRVSFRIGACIIPCQWVYKCLLPTLWTNFNYFKVFFSNKSTRAHPRNRPLWVTEVGPLPRGGWCRLGTSDAPGGRCHGGRADHKERFLSWRQKSQWEFLIMFRTQEAAGVLLIEPYGGWEQRLKLNIDFLLEKSKLVRVSSMSIVWRFLFLIVVLHSLSWSIIDCSGTDGIEEQGFTFKDHL